MITTNTQKITAGLIIALSLIATPAFAQTKATASSTANSASKLAAVIAKADKDVDARLASLNDLNTKVQAMKNVSATAKSSISDAVQTNISGLTTLRAKIDADTDAKTARTDAATIFTTYRIYALVIPQGYIEVASDRVATVSGLITPLVTKLQARITAAQSAGNNVSALQNALADITTQVTAANTAATTAVNGVSSLVPDQGKASVIASNKTALQSARKSIQTAEQALKAARKDIQTIVSGLKGLHMNTSASSTTAH